MSGSPFRISTGEWAQIAPAAVKLGHTTSLRGLQGFAQVCQGESNEAVTYSSNKALASTRICRYEPDRAEQAPTSKAERWLSGRKHRTRNAAYGQPYRGFESHPLRHNLSHHHMICEAARTRAVHASFRGSLFKRASLSTRLRRPGNKIASRLDICFRMGGGDVPVVSEAGRSIVLLASGHPALPIARPDMASRVLCRVKG